MEFGAFGHTVCVTQSPNTCTREHPISIQLKRPAFARKRKAEDWHFSLRESIVPENLHTRENHHHLENNYFKKMCSGSEAGSYLRLTDFVYHSTLGLRAIKRRSNLARPRRAALPAPPPRTGASPRAGGPDFDFMDIYIYTYIYIYIYMYIYIYIYIYIRGVVTWHGRGAPHPLLLLSGWEVPPSGRFLSRQAGRVATPL